MTTLYFDIETLPADGKSTAIIKQLWEESKKKARAGASPQKFEDFFRGTSFSGEWGRIFCIGFAIDDQPAEVLVGDEKEILEKFWLIAKWPCMNSAN